MAFNGHRPPHIKSRLSGWKLAVVAGLVLVVFWVGAQQLYGRFTAYLSNNAAYAEGIALLHANGAAKAMLGAPIEVGAMLAGNVHTYNNTTGVASYTLAVSGPRCAGKLYLQGALKDELWTLTMWVLESECAEDPLVLRDSDNLQSEGTSQEA